MKRLLRQLIIDFQSDTLPTGSLRHFCLQPVSGSIRKAHILMGMRRSGKTWIMYQYIRDLLNQGIEKSKILYINFEDDRLIPFSAADFQSILDAYFELYPDYLGRTDIHFFFDEIHEKTGWEKFIRRLLDKEKMQIYITGSSAKMLSKEIASSLRGRALDYEIFPFSFSEYLHYFSGKSKENHTLTLPISKQSSSDRIRVKHYLDHYLSRGGFPETIDQSDSLARTLLQSYVDAVVYRDIIDRYQIKNTRILKYLLIYAIQNSASLLSIQKVYHHFKSNGESIGKNYLYDFMDYFEDAYCIMQVPLFSLSARKRSQAPKKIYPIDQGLLSAYSDNTLFNRAALFEIMVFSHIRRHYPTIYYYKTATNKEIDFVIQKTDNQLILIQVCIDMSDSKTIQREESALAEAMTELGVSTGIIVTYDQIKQSSHHSGNTKMDWKPFVQFIEELP